MSEVVAQIVEGHITHQLPLLFGGGRPQLTPPVGDARLGEAGAALASMSRLLALRARTNELQLLRVSVAQTRPQLILLSGQRRVGKTFLVQQLLAGRDGNVVPLYFEATQAGPAAEIARFHRTLSAALPGDVLPPGPTPTSWEQALRLTAFAARRHPLVVAIDEATYLMSSTPSFASEVQVVWDWLTAQADPPRLSLILTGSAMGMVEDALSTGGALYQRPTLTIAGGLPTELADAGPLPWAPSAAPLDQFSDAAEFPSPSYDPS
ncbi:MAG: ATP-binding protein [Actinomycetota bacterium]|nr:ATP-binding protein [Actinomycetota bacterium]